MKPRFLVTLNSATNSQEVLMVVDSGAELSLISRDVGNALGFSLSSGEPITTGQGIGGT